MNTIILAKSGGRPMASGKKSWYRTLSLIDLIKEIANRSDLQALC